MDYRVEIDETHHIHKKDAPSGTALRLGEKVAEGREQDFKSVMIHEPGKTHDDEISEEEPEPYPTDKIVIHSHRIGEVVGDHTVSFADEGETLEFTHHAWSREAFAMGALRAAQWVMGRKPGLYDMQDVLGL
jgi:4-hydroxy-tetrahydrodipicolinate reductase